MKCRESRFEAFDVGTVILSPGRIRMCGLDGVDYVHIGEGPCGWPGWPNWRATE